MARHVAMFTSPEGGDGVDATSFMNHPCPEAEAISPKPIRLHTDSLVSGRVLRRRQSDIYPDAQTAKPEPEPESLDSDSATRRQGPIG